jgi:alpha-1,3-mannosyltransferase
VRLLHITPAYAPSVGGIEDVVANLARLGRVAGIEADVAHVSRGLAEGERREGTFSVWTLPLLGHRLLGWAPGLGELAARYDLLHVHDPQVGALTLNLGGRLATVPALLSTHGGFFHTQGARLAKRVHQRLTAPRLLKRYAKVMASSHTDLDLFRPIAPNTILVENGVNTTKLAVEPAIGTRDLRRWIFWGRLSQNKRIDSLIHLMAALRQQGLPVDLAICGSDFEGKLASLRDLVARLHLENQITFRPGLDNDSLRAEIASRAVFVLPSEYEGFGLTILEAMAAGLVPMCRDLAPMNVLAGKSALLLDFDGGPGDVGKVRKLLAASTAEHAGLQKVAMARAASFDWSCRFKAFLQQYEACTGSGPR